MAATGEVERANQQLLDYLGKTLEELTEWALFLHPDDSAHVLAYWRQTIESGQPYEVEHRLRRADGAYRWFQVRGRPQHDAEGRIVRWYNLVTDIDDRKRAEGELEKAFEEIAKSATELRTVIDAIPQLIVAIRADGNFLSANQAFLEYTGLTKEGLGSEKFRTVFHPEDWERLRDERAAAISRGVPFKHERRVRHRDGQYRWFLVQYNPLRDERGEVIRWYATATDIDDRKQAEERTRQENFALREQIDQAFMFEEIVGSSPALKTVLSSIVKVAPTDSTVLITGETGTGKELIARAIHKGSQRVSQAFIAVNCASIPSSLIASELFGHEKGPSPVPCSGGKAVLSWGTRSRFFSMKSVSFPRKRRLRCCVCFRSANLNGWEVAGSFPVMFESSLLPIAIWRRPLLQDHFALTSSTG